MITRAVLTVLGVLGLCLLLVAQEPNPGEHGNGQTITQQDLLGTGEIDVVPALALYQEGHFERFIGGIGTREEILKQLPLA